MSNSDTSFHIRPFAPQDYQQVVALWDKVFDDAKPWNEPITVLCRKQAQGDRLLFVGETDGLIVGTVIAGYDGIRGWIYSLAVTPEQRRKRFGSRMMDHAEQALVKLGCPKVNLHVRATNSDVVSFYQHLAFGVEDRVSLGKQLDWNSSEIQQSAPSIQLSGGFSISPLDAADKQRIVKHLNVSDEISSRTAAIPFPYTEFDFDQWFTIVATSNGSTWAIRSSEGEAIGSIGLRLDGEHKAELGYWLAKNYWGQGIVTNAVGRVCEHGFRQRGLRRIYAQVLTTNTGSARVLAKSGFTLEGTLRQHFCRDGICHDMQIFGLVLEELTG